jgi:predicted ATPase
MVQVSDPSEFPLLDDLRRRSSKWRFYHGFRTDSDAPLRSPAMGIRTFVVAGDGSDLAAALRTILENGDDVGLQRAVQDAFPGAKLWVHADGGRLEVSMEYPDMARPMRARELSDGTLRYLCLLAALKSLTPAP